MDKLKNGKEEFKNEMKIRIKAGEVLQERIAKREEFRELQQDYNTWNNDNAEYLKVSFTDERSGVKNRYDLVNLGAEFSSIKIMGIPVKKKEHTLLTGYVANKLQVMNNILNEVEAY